MCYTEAGCVIFIWQKEVKLSRETDASTEQRDSCAKSQNGSPIPSLNKNKTLIKARNIENKATSELQRTATDNKFKLHGSSIYALCWLACCLSNLSKHLFLCVDQH